MKKLSFIATALSVAIVSSATSADPYVGGKLGYTSLSNACYTGSPCDDDSFAGGIYAGYNFTDMLSLEAGYDYLGDFKTAYQDNGSIATIDDNMTAYTLAPKVTFPIDNLDLFLKLGAAKIDYKNVDDIILLSSFGMEYGFADNLAARFEYQRLNNVQESFEGMDIGSLFLGLTYTFASQPEPVPVVETIVEPEPAPTIKVYKEFGTELFATNSFTLAQGSEQYFNELVTIMKKYPQANLSITGHTDSRGSESYNQKLSENRAKSVADYIIAQGVDASRVTYKGVGELEPKASNETALSLIHI